MSRFEKENIRSLKEYFEKESSILMAFVFGSRAKGFQKPISDWDIAVYFRPEQYAELETACEYPDEHRIWRNVENILQS